MKKLIAVVALLAVNLVRAADTQDGVAAYLNRNYATALRLFKAEAGLHTLARQMGTSVLMLERFYSKVNATKAAERLAK